MIRKKAPQNKIKTILIGILIILIFLLFSPLIILIIVFHFLAGKRLGVRVRREWYPKGKFLLFVYSDSPHWKEYTEQNILPRISSKAVVINWSKRSEWEWKGTLELQIFQHWTGIRQYFVKNKKRWYGREFCPAAIVFNPWWKPKVIKFWQAFKNFKRDNELDLKRCEKELFDLVEKNLPTRSEIT